MPETENLIEFHGDGSQPFPRPIPAVQDVPAWLKQMPAEVENPRGGSPIDTVKKCPPFLEAVTGGYLIPLIADVTFEMQPTGLRIHCDLPIIESHPLEQLRQTPVDGMPIVKFRNPWIVKTPPGYSCLFVQPLNRFDLPFHVLSGVVETDTYYREIHFPSICLLKPGSTHLLKKGTPIVQIYPIKRESWRSAYSKTELQHRESVEAEFNSATAHYRQNTWRRKDYK
jgi:hypothetical protein